jgi:hypothetical protein
MGGNKKTMFSLLKMDSVKKRRRKIRDGGSMEAGK